ncbi:MAG: DUF3035 domain-containing protein [Pseudomonadota bacterium]
MTPKPKLISLTAAVVALALGGCASSANSGPDEFRIVKKAPLVVPPDYNLRPPTPGQALPREVDVAAAGTLAAFGTNIGSDASPSERALVAAAGANAVNPIVRQQVDYEEARIIRKSPSVSDRIMFWRRGGDDDQAAEDSATGGEDVVISRGGGSRIKLPGT